MRRGVIIALSFIMVLAPLGPALAAICSNAGQPHAHACCDETPACSTPAAAVEKPCCSAVPSSQNSPAQQAHKRWGLEKAPQLSPEEGSATAVAGSGFTNRTLLAHLLTVAHTPAISLPLRR
jgi:hypothetical protein